MHNIRRCPFSICNCMNMNALIAKLAYVGHQVTLLPGNSLTKLVYAFWRLSRNRAPDGHCGGLLGLCWVINQS